jgi:Uma2 family endonuclease
VGAHGPGSVFIAPFDVILDKTSVVVPDLCFVRRERLEIVTNRGVEGAPDLIVEILSPGTARRDRGEKAQLYARHGCVTTGWRMPIRGSSRRSSSTRADTGRPPG